MTAYGVRISDWSSDVCSSDLTPRRPRSARLASFPSFPSFPIPHSRSMPTLNGQTLFITGASRGIGLAIALRAARDGANVAIAAKSDVPNPKLPGTIHTAAQAVDERSEENTSELQSLMRISYAVFCLKKENRENNEQT